MDGRAASRRSSTTFPSPFYVLLLHRSTPSFGSTDHRGARLARFYIIERCVNPELLPGGKQVAPGVQLFLYDGPVYSKFVEAFDEVPLRAVCHPHRDVRVVRLERLIRRCLFCARPFASRRPLKCSAEYETTIVAKLAPAWHTFPV